MEEPKAVKGRRRMLLLVAVLFAAPLVIAMLLQAVGWHPLQTRNAGTLVEPPVALADAPVRDLAGAPLVWEVAERGWNMLVLAPAACAGDCAAFYDRLHRVWLTQGRHADRVRVLWAGPLPPGAMPYPAMVQVQAGDELLARLPHAADADAAPLYLVDGRGFLALRYAPGFDPSGLRKDLSRLLK